MFEKFVNGKINSENEIVNNLTELSRENILKSNLSDFTKNFLINDPGSFNNSENLKDAISKSNKLYFNFTIRPKWTLLAFLFNNFESRSPNDVLSKLNYFPFYKFYPDSITSYIEESAPIFVTRTEIQKIIDETNIVILEKLTNDISNLKIKNFFLQIFLLKYENESKFNLESTINYSVVKLFLEDKSYTELARKFSNIKHLNEDSVISLKDIIKILTDKFNVTVKDADEIIINSVSDAVIPAEEITDSDEIIITEKAEEMEKSVYSEELIKAEEVISELRSAEKEIPEEHVSSIRKLFDDEQTENIINKIYQSDLMKTKDSFEKLEECSTWKKASKHLKEVFKNNNVDIYNKDVISFVNILNEYYNRME